MGRPINKRHFGLISTGTASAGTISGVQVVSGGKNYSNGVTMSVSAPTGTGNVAAVVEPVVSSGVITHIAVVNGGIGYIAQPVYTLTAPTSVAIAAAGNSGDNYVTVGNVTGIYVGMSVKDSTGEFLEIENNSYVVAVSGTSVTLSTQLVSSVSGMVTFADVGQGFVAGTSTIITQTAKRVSVQTAVSSSGNVILSQVSARRYKIRDTSGNVNVCKLVSAVATSGECTILCTDSDGNTYWVKKWQSNKVTVMPKTLALGQISFQFGSTSNDASAEWTFGAAVLGKSVSIAMEA